MITIQVDDITDRLPITLSTPERTRVELLIADAVEMIEVAFQKAGRDLEAELISVVWLPAVVRRVVREMVSAAVIVGPNAGVRQVSSTTGPQSDSVVYDRTDVVSFAGVRLTDAQEEELGLSSVGPRGSFPAAPRWPEVRLR